MKLVFSLIIILTPIVCFSQSNSSEIELKLKSLKKELSKKSNQNNKELILSIKKLEEQISKYLPSLKTTTQKTSTPVKVVKSKETLLTEIKWVKEKISLSKDPKHIKECNKFLIKLQAELKELN